jgi:hypothetical protein
MRQSLKALPLPLEHFPAARRRCVHNTRCPCKVTVRLPGGCEGSLWVG